MLIPRLSTIFISAIILLLSLRDKLFACSCVNQRTVKEEIMQSDAVFVGIVLNKQIISLTDSTDKTTFESVASVRKMSISRYDFLVQEIYKGEITSDTVSIYTGLGGGDCGVRFEIGKKYIVYGVNKTYLGQINDNIEFLKTKNAFWTYLCLRTTPYYQEEITELKKYCKKHKVRHSKK